MTSVIYMSPLWVRDNELDVVPRFVAEFNDSTDLTEATTSNDYLPHPLSPFKFLFIVVTLVSTIIGLVGNTLLVVIYARDTSTRITTNAYILSIAVADLLVTVTCSAVQLLQDVMGTWPFNEVGCKLLQAGMELSTVVSALTLTAFSIERYYAIIHPLKWYTSNRESTIVASSVIWFVSAVCCIPRFIHSGVRRHSHFGVRGYKIASHCVVYQDRTLLARYISMVDFTVFYAIPLCIICGMYAAVSHRLIQSASDLDSFGAKNVTQLRMVRLRKKVAKLVIVLSAIFFLGFLPHNILILRIFFLELEDGYWNSAASFAYCYGFQHYWMNPIALYFFNDFVKGNFDYYFTCGLTKKPK